MEMNAERHAVATLPPTKNAVKHSVRGRVSCRVGLGVLEERKISWFYQYSNPEL